MNETDIQTMLIELGCERIRVGNTGWVYASCPLTWRHPSGKDSQPSFAVSIAPNGISHYKCHACHAVGPLPTLIWSIRRRPGTKDLSKLMNFVQAKNVMSTEEIEARRKRAADDGYWNDKQKKVAGVAVSPAMANALPVDLKLPVLPESTLDPFRELPAGVLDYLKARGLSEASIAGWEIGWQPRMRRISIPIRNCEGELVGMSGRAFNAGQKPKWMHSSGFRRDFYLYGEDKASKGVRGFLCEGFFDVIYLQQCGYNAVAMMGSHLSKFQIDKLQRFFSALTIVPDGDEPGYKAAIEANDMIAGRLETTVAKMPEGKDPDELSPEGLFQILGPPTFL